MNPDTIKLQSLNKQFYYESQVRLIEQMEPDEILDAAKSYLKLYLLQQEALESLGLTFEDESDTI
jgi:hypothetical protein